MKSYKTLEDCLENIKNNEHIFKTENCNKCYIVSDIKNIKKYYTKHKNNIYQYIDNERTIRFFFNIILNHKEEKFEDILAYNIKILKFNMNDLIIYQEDELKYVVIHKYYYMDNIDELNLYLLNLNLLKIKVIEDNFIDLILNQNILIFEKCDLNDTIINNIISLLKLENKLNIENINKCDKYVNNINFDVNDTIFIKSKMGSGKTTAVIDYIKKNNIKSFLIISCRKTLTYSLCEKLKENNIDVNNYITLKKCNIKLSERLIISPDSLYKIDYPLKKFDLIWIDECVSLMSYLGNYLFINEQKNNDITIIIDWLFKNCKNFLLTDADLNDNIIRYYLYYRQIENSVLINYDNFIDENNYILYEEENIILEKLIDDLNNNNNIYICTDTLKGSKKIYNIIVDLNIVDTNDILLYNSESDNKYEKEMYNVNEFWSKYKIIIVSPKVIFGVDFTLKYIDYIYCFYSCNTITVRECIQQIGRIRNLRKKHVNIYIKNVVKKDIEYNIVNIKYDLENNINNIFYKQSINDINNILKLLKFNINKMGYKNIDINDNINYLLIYSLYEKNVNLKKYIELLKKKLYITNN